MRVCKYLNQRVRRIEEWNENLSRVFKKQKKTYMKKLNSIIQDWDFYYRLPVLEKSLEKCLGFCLLIAEQNKQNLLIRNLENSEN